MANEYESKSNQKQQFQIRSRKRRSRTTKSAITIQRIDPILTGEMSRILDFLGQTATGCGGRSVGDNLLDQKDECETSFAELPHDPKPILIDPHVASTVDGVVKRVQSRKRTAHAHESLRTAHSLSSFLDQRIDLQNSQILQIRITRDLEFFPVSFFYLCLIIWK